MWYEPTVVECRSLCSMFPGSNLLVIAIYRLLLSILDLNNNNNNNNDDAT